MRKVLEQARSGAGGPTARLVPGPFADNLAAGPYVQLAADGSVLMRWAAIQCDAVVRYGPDGRLTVTATASRLAWPRWMYEVRLTGLKAGTDYAYAIRIGGADVRGTFLTPPAGDAPFSFAVWGDSQCYPDVFAGVTRQMAQHPVDLALCVGDAVEEGQTDGDYYRQLFQPMRDVLRDAFLLSAVGNHERMADPDLARRNRFLRNPAPERTYFAVTYAGCRFIVLDSNDPGLFDGAQLAWLKQELASDACTGARFRFLLVHHAPFCWDWYGGEQKVQQVVVPLAEAGKVDVLFAGHFHCYERGARTTNGHQTWYVVTGGGAGFFTDERWGPGHHDRDFMIKHAWRHHFMLAQVDAAGLHVQAIADTGETLDEFEIDRPAAGQLPAPPARAPRQAPAPAAASGRVALPVDEVRWCRIAAADRQAALAALAECGKALRAKEPEAADRLARVSALLKEARDLSREGVWTGTAEATVHLIPRLVVQDVHYRLKPSEEADASVRDILDRIGNSSPAQLRGKRFEVRGLDTPVPPQRWILVDSVTEK